MYEKYDHFSSVIFSCMALSAMDATQSKVQTKGDEEIVQFSVHELQNVRNKSVEERRLLFEKLKASFERETALGKIRSLPNLQVLVWFSNYFGSVMRETLMWYREAIFKELPSAAFWLTDLKKHGLCCQWKRTAGKAHIV